jgi:hypothetical protein
VTVTDLEYANLTLDVYKGPAIEVPPSEPNDSLIVEIDDWIDRTELVPPVNFEYPSPSVGLAVHTKGDNVVIAIDGWEGPTTDEVYEALAIGVGTVGRPYAQTYFFSQAAIDTLGAAKNIGFVGHSQGGAARGTCRAG